MEQINKIIIFLISIGLIAGFFLGFSVGNEYQQEKIIGIIENKGVFRIDNDIYFTVLTDYQLDDIIILNNFDVLNSSINHSLKMELK